MTTFALVHGAWHRGTCWDPLAARLRDAGHTVVTPDLPAEDPAATLEDGAATVLDALGDAGDDVVVVGHSLGGLTIPLVAGARPVRELVFVCAFTPTPAATAQDDLLADPEMFSPGWPALAAHQQSHDDGSSSWPADAAIEAFYHDCPPDLAAWAAGQLRRQCWAVVHEPSPLTAFPRVPARAIVCSEDRVLRADTCARNAATHYGASIVRLPGGHSPMLAQPDALADALLLRP